jgi:hypothetical protein
MLPSGRKLSLGLLVTIILEVVPFCAYVPFPELLSFIKCILEVVSVKVFINACDSASCQNGGFSVLSSMGETEKLGWVERDSHVVFFFAKNFLVKKECDTVRCRDAAASSFVAKVRGQVFAMWN